ncbi:hypothetical protein IEQ34_021028 [Dendrobium chrysotoxum]|uniref:Uncharacterized protein n=1 Tax=Dendrobium chrysotoxum TaxID=161865 RepID=A0AAV7G2I0_DENCH|nr:hypothetical protein IEQ34_021028 [Dendrobium chrysotoxum]
MEFECFGGDVDDLLGEGDAEMSGVVFFHPEATVGAVVGREVGADDVYELVFGAGEVGRGGGEEDGGAAEAEEAVGDKHGAELALVPAWGSDDFGGDY